MAENLMSRALGLRESFFGTGDSESAQALSSLSGALSDQGKPPGG